MDASCVWCNVWLLRNTCFFKEKRHMKKVAERLNGVGFLVEIFHIMFC